MRAQHASSHLDFVAAQSALSRRHVLERPLPEGLMARFDQSAHASLEAQAAIEAADTIDFETFRQQYLDPAQLQG